MSLRCHTNMWSGAEFRSLDIDSKVLLFPQFLLLPMFAPIHYPYERHSHGHIFAPPGNTNAAVPSASEPRFNLIIAIGLNIQIQIYICEGCLSKSINSLMMILRCRSVLRRGPFLWLQISGPLVRVRHISNCGHQHISAPFRGAHAVCRRCWKALLTCDCYSSRCSNLRTWWVRIPYVWQWLWNWHRKLVKKTAMAWHGLHVEPLLGF